MRVEEYTPEPTLTAWRLPVDYDSIYPRIKDHLPWVGPQSRVGPVAPWEEDYYSGRAITVIIGRIPSVSGHSLV